MICSAKSARHEMDCFGAQLLAIEFREFGLRWEGIAIPKIHTPPIAYANFLLLAAGEILQ